MTDLMINKESKKKDAPPQREAEKVIIASKISKSFGSNIVLEDISFHLKKKENLIIMGRSGSGKSVLLKCAVGLVIPDEGKLTVLGKDMEELEGHELNEQRRKVGYLFQGGALYDAMTVRKNLEFPLKRLPERPPKNEIRDKVEEVLDNVGLLDSIDKMPSELSGGMKKRIALARTLILEPKIMLYDEPTTGLDMITSKEISHLMLKMQNKYGISSITVTHDLACAKITSNRICILKEGNFIAEGDYETLKDSENEEVRPFFQN